MIFLLFSGYLTIKQYSTECEWDSKVNGMSEYINKKVCEWVNEVVGRQQQKKQQKSLML